MLPRLPDTQDEIFGKGLFRSLAPGDGEPGTGEKNGAPPPKPAKPAPSGGKSGAQPGSSRGASSARRRNNRKRKR